MDIIELIAAMMLVTFLIRAASLLLFSGQNISPLMLRALSMIPVAVLCAICGPLIFRPDKNWENPLTLIEFWSAIGCIVAARFGLVPAIIVGMMIYGTGMFFDL